MVLMVMGYIPWPRGGIKAMCYRMCFVMLVAGMSVVYGCGRRIDGGIGGHDIAGDVVEVSGKDEVSKGDGKDIADVDVKDVDAIKDQVIDGDIMDVDEGTWSWDFVGWDVGDVQEDDGHSCHEVFGPQVYKNRLCSREGSVDISGGKDTIVKAYHYCSVVFEPYVDFYSDCGSITACHADKGIKPDSEHPRWHVKEKVPFRPAVKVKDMWVDKDGKLWIELFWLNGRITWPTEAIELDRFTHNYRSINCSSYICYWEPYADITRRVRLSGAVPQLLPSGILTYRVDPTTLKVEFMGEEVFTPKTIIQVRLACNWFPDYYVDYGCKDFIRFGAKTPPPPPPDNDGVPPQPNKWETMLKTECDICSYPYDGIVVKGKRFVFLPGDCILHHGRRLTVPWIKEDQEDVEYMKTHGWDFIDYDISLKDRTLRVIRVKDAHAIPYGFAGLEATLALPVDVRLLDYKDILPSGAACDRCLNPIDRPEPPYEHSTDDIYYMYGPGLVKAPVIEFGTMSKSSIYAYLDPWEPGMSVWSAGMHFHLDSTLTYVHQGSYTSIYEECTQLPYNHDITPTMFGISSPYLDTVYPTMFGKPLITKYRPCFYSFYKKPTAWCPYLADPYVHSSSKTTIVQLKPGNPGILRGWTRWDMQAESPERPAPGPYFHVFQRKLRPPAIAKGREAVKMPGCLSGVHRDCGIDPCGRQDETCAAGCDGRECVDRKVGTLKWWLDLKDVFTSVSLLAGDHIILRGRQYMHVVDLENRTQKRFRLSSYRNPARTHPRDQDSFSPGVAVSRNARTNDLSWKEDGVWRFLYNFSPTDVDFECTSSNYDDIGRGFRDIIIGCMDIGGGLCGYYKAPEERFYQLPPVTYDHKVLGDPSKFKGWIAYEGTWLLNIMDSKNHFYGFKIMDPPPTDTGKSIQYYYVVKFGKGFHELASIKLKYTDFYKGVPSWPLWGWCMGSDNRLYHIDVHRLFSVSGDLKEYKVKEFSPEVFVQALSCGKNHMLYLSGEDGRVYKIDPYMSGDGIKWTFDTHDILVTQVLIGHDERLIFASQKGFVYALDNKGRLLWKTKVGPIYVSNMVITKDRQIYVADLTGTLTAIDEDTGKVKWRYYTIAPIITTPIVDRHGTIYVVDAVGYFYAINGTSPIASTPWPTLNHDQHRNRRFGAPQYQ